MQAQAGLLPSAIILLFYLSFACLSTAALHHDGVAQVSRKGLLSDFVPGHSVTFLGSEAVSADHLPLWNRHIARRGPSKPNTAVVLLNWARLLNLVFQASVYCSSSLQDLVEFVFIWNNRPDLKLTFDEHFASTGCRREQLKIYNSPTNVLFQARFMACLRTGSHYCFLQDDDYITSPEILRNIHASVSRFAANNQAEPKPVILQPSHDLLESVLLNISVPFGKLSLEVINTRFACLGHGTFMLRSQAKAFLDQLTQLGLSEEEKTIADNYFTILRAEQPMTWLTHSRELSESNALPFTLGQQGSERNWYHINRAMSYLSNSSIHANIKNLENFEPSSQISPCILDACTMSTSIAMLPSYVTSPVFWTPDTLMQTVQSERHNILGQEGVRWYIEHPLSKAVDGDPHTSFRSFGYGRRGDRINVQLFPSTTWQDNVQAEFVWLVDSWTASIIQNSVLELSWNDQFWVNLGAPSLTCMPVNSLELPEDFFHSPPTILSPLTNKVLSHTTLLPNTTYPELHILECSQSMVFTQGSPQSARVTLTRDMHAIWVVFEFWIRMLE